MKQREAFGFPKHPDPCLVHEICQQIVNRLNKTGPPKRLDC